MILKEGDYREDKEPVRIVIMSDQKGRPKPMIIKGGVS